MKTLSEIERHPHVDVPPIAPQWRRRMNPAGGDGAFLYRPEGRASKPLLVLTSADAGWDHVSVTVYNTKRCPTWRRWMR